MATGASQGYGQGVWVEALPLAGGAEAGSKEASETVFGRIRFESGHLAIEFRHDSLKRFFLTDQTSAPAGLPSDGTALRAVQEKSAGRGRPFRERDGGGEIEVSC